MHPPTTVATEKDAPYYTSAEPLVPHETDLNGLALAASGCKACHLWKCGTQTVFGNGASQARIMLVGEQPGDKEDVEGLPFVGPAGKLLRAVLEEAGISEEVVYMTNAVKHFKWEPKGNRRLHKRPVYREVQACFPWLRAEIEKVEPEVVVCLGATAGQALFGKDFKVTEGRSVFRPGPFGRTYFTTVHPSSILRAFDSEKRHREREAFVADLRLVANYLATNVASKVSVR